MIQFSTTAVRISQCSRKITIDICNLINDSRLFNWDKFLSEYNVSATIIAVVGYTDVPSLLLFKRILSKLFPGCVIGLEPSLTKI